MDLGGTLEALEGYRCARSSQRLLCEDGREWEWGRVTLPLIQEIDSFSNSMITYNKFMSTCLEARGLAGFALVRSVRRLLPQVRSVSLCG